MMRRSDETPEEPLLFDLPLDPPERGAERGPERAEAPARKRPARPAFDAAEEPVLPLQPLQPIQETPPPRTPRTRTPTEEARLALLRPVAEPAREDRRAGRDENETGGHERPGLASRLAAGGADLLVHVAVAVAALVGVRFLGVRPVLTDWPAVLLFLLSFSFLYCIVPLAFWGHTLGMAWAGLTANNRDGEPLTFDQTVRRWLGGLVTTGLLGIPLLLTGRRSLADLLSGSETYLQPSEEE
jgi:uncharacterized RDD family membrane protein YckC